MARMTSNSVFFLYVESRHHRKSRNRNVGSALLTKRLALKKSYRVKETN